MWLEYNDQRGRESGMRLETWQALGSGGWGATADWEQYSEGSGSHWRGLELEWETEDKV